MPDSPQLPASLTGQPPMGSSPVSAPSGNPGAKAMAISKIRMAADMINSVVSQLDVGSEEHAAALDVIKKLSRIAPASAAVPGLQSTTIKGVAADAEKSAMMQSLLRGQGGPGQGAAAGGAPPQQPDPTAGMAG